MATSDKLNFLKQTKEEIKNAIVAKGGTIADGATFRSYKDAIAAIETGGGELPEEAFNISGVCSYRFANGCWDWFINEYGNKVKTSDLTQLNYMFSKSKVKKIPFEINCLNGAAVSLSYLFESCNNLEELPKINNCKPTQLEHLCQNCSSLKELPADINDWFDWSHIENLTGSYNGSTAYMFSGCHKLRSIPVDFLSHVNPGVGYSSSYYYAGFNVCYSLDELTDLPVPYTGTWSSNGFTNFINNCYRLKSLTFALQEDGTPYVMKWKNQTIDLSSVGLFGYKTQALEIGFTADKEVKDAATYASLKNDPDWFTADVKYSRYNKESAIATIQSLPDCSATGTNTIKFKSAAGELTDGGKIGDISSELIALAASRGWTVTLA